MIGSRIIAAIFLALLFSFHTAHADDWYQVEVIVFEYLYPETDGEYWYTNPLLPSLLDSVSLVTEEDLLEAEQEEAAEDRSLPETGADITPDTTAPEPGEEEPVAFKVLPQDSHRLEGIYRVLELSRDYRPVHHVAWQQPALGGREAKSVHLQIDEPATGEDQEAAGGPVDTGEEITADLPAGPGSVLFDGTIRIRSSQFLHVDIDMVNFRAPPSPAVESVEAAGPGRGEQGAGEEPGSDRKPGIEVDRSPATMDSAIAEEYADYVSLTETRRIRLNELHYFDHPMFGVILQVSRMEEEE